MVSPVGLCWRVSMSHPDSKLVLALGTALLPQLPHGSLQLVELNAWPSGSAGPAPERKSHRPGSQGPWGSLVSFPVPQPPPELLTGGSVPSLCSASGTLAWLHGSDPADPEDWGGRGGHQEALVARGS